MREITDEIKTYIREKFHYNPKTGDLWWTFKENSRICGNKTGKNRDYLSIEINCPPRSRKSFKVHRVAWFLYYGKFPENEIDHIDRNSLNNKIENLREATHGQNMCNRDKLKNNTSGIKGVFWRKDYNKWRAAIRFNKKLLHLGNFNTKEEASVAYQKKATELFGEFNPSVT